MKNKFSTWNKEVLLVIYDNLVKENNRLLEVNPKKITESQLEAIRNNKMELAMLKNIIINKFLQEDYNINVLARYYIRSNEIDENLFADLLVRKIITSKEIYCLDVDVINKAINKLDIDHLWLITKTKNELINSLSTQKLEKIFVSYEKQLQKEFMYKVNLST